MNDGVSTGLRLSAFYFLFFGGVGIFAPYWTLYLKSLGLDATTIGTLMALLMATRIVGPNLWGWLADRRGRRMGVIRGGACAALLVFAWVPAVREPVPLALLLVGYYIFWSAVLPQFEAVTLGHLGPRAARYSRIRLWGSVGFIVSSAAVGPVLDAAGAGVLPWLVLASMASIAVMSFAVSEPPGTDGSPTGGSIAMPPAVRSMVMVLLACALMQASHGPYYVFFSIHLQQQGYPAGEIGALWALGVVAEVALFAVMPRVLAVAPHAVLFAGCFVLTALRWLMLALLPATLPVLVLVQLLHAISFGAHHAVAIALVHRLFAGARQGRGQALFSSLSYGAGGAAGSAVAGWLWAGSGPAATWFAAAAVAALGGAVALGVRVR